jgi:predicted helicase
LPVPGATLTDTFQITEDGDRADTSLIPVNNDRIEAQLAAPIKVIVGNPPYSAGQGSANDNNANLKYPTLDARLGATYGKLSSSSVTKSLFDSYIRAFRWATDRLGDQGVIGFVSNNGWVDGNTADGIRKAFVYEFSDIWLYNLRGNQRTAGELSRQEGGKVFGSGARTGVAVLIAVKRNGATRPCMLRYYGVADYQRREDKLAEIGSATLPATAWRSLTPNIEGDWLSQRSAAFDLLPAMGAKRGTEIQPTTFGDYSLGLATARDAWCFNFSGAEVVRNVERMIGFYNSQVNRGIRTNSTYRDFDPRRISWGQVLERMLDAGTLVSMNPGGLRTGMYRPFVKQACYMDRSLNHSAYRLPRIFPTDETPNLGIAVVTPGIRTPFCAVMTDCLPVLGLYMDPAQYFPRWTHEKVTDLDQGSLLEPSDVDEWGYRRVDNITDGILKLYQDKFGSQVSKDDIFNYVYGVLHSEQYRNTFAADLKRMLPRIPLAGSWSDFEAFVDAGRHLADLHVNYETVEPYPLAEQAPLNTMTPWETFRVEKMRWADKTTKKSIIYNKHVTLGDIPAEANRYMLGSRSALEWLIDRYQVKTDKASGIVNDPNNWGREHHDPRYIVDLVKRVTRVSVETMKIVDNLPELPLS